MPVTAQVAKAALRREIRARLEQMTAENRASASMRASWRLAQQAVWRNAKLILFYAPLPNEVNIWPLLVESLKAGKAIALPRFDPATGAYVACQIENLERELVIGQFGIREPGADCPRITQAGVDLILVPGVAFDLNGQRLGRGKGYYDRLLASVRGLKCGVAFDQQVVSKVPAGEHDVRLDYLVTPTRWLNC